MSTNAILTQNAGGQRRAAIAAAAVAAATVAAYAPNFSYLIGQWTADPNYSHGFMVIPIALAIAYQRRGELPALARLRPAAWGWPVVLAALAARALLYERNEQWAEALTLLPATLGLLAAFGGWPLLRWALPAVGFLVFMYPLPPSVNRVLAGPLQQLATIGSTWLLQFLGLPVLAEGNVIYVGAERLEVAQACNGLSMLVSFVTLIAATILILARDRPIWERVVLFLSTVPIALVTNILRIAATAWAYSLLGAERGEKIAHDLAGWAMMPVALGLILAELKLLSWLVVEERQPEKMVIPSSFSARTRPPKKPT